MSNQVREFIAVRHAHWCSVLENHTHYQYARPTLVIGPCDSPADAGQYNGLTWECTIDMHYALRTTSARLDELVAHEVCHHYQRCIAPRSLWHGRIFHRLLRVVCGFMDADQYHHTDLDTVGEVGEVC